MSVAHHLARVYVSDYSGVDNDDGDMIVITGAVLAHPIGKHATGEDIDRLCIYYQDDDPTKVQLTIQKNEDGDPDCIDEYTLSVRTTFDVIERTEPDRTTVKRARDETDSEEEEEEEEPEEKKQCV